MRGDAFWIGLDLITKDRRCIIQTAQGLISLGEHYLGRNQIWSLLKKVKHRSYDLLSSAVAKIDLTEEQNGLDVIRILRQGLVQDERCLGGVFILQIGARQVVFYQQGLRIACVETL